MPCLLALLALISPRLVLILLWIFSSVLSHAFNSWILPLLGFFLLPWTTLAYAAFWSWGPGHHVTGFEWFFVVLAFLIDLGSYGGGRFAAAGADGARTGERGASPASRAPSCGRSRAATVRGSEPASPGPAPGAP